MTYTVEKLGGAICFRFADKPSDRIRAILKRHRFRWNPAQGVWWRSPPGGWADVVTAINYVLDPNPIVGPCWACGDPNGRFRSYGAATPVYCDGCEAKVRERRAVKGGA